jgi:alpha-N-acetylglucosaminidase
MMLAWQGNPRQDLLAGVDRKHLLIIDIDHDRVPRDDRQKDFQGAPFLFGGIWEFGGRTTLGANIDNITERDCSAWPHQQQHGRHRGVYRRHGHQSVRLRPVYGDGLAQRAARYHAWTADYVKRRYGAPIHTHWPPGACC